MKFSNFIQRSTFEGIAPQDLRKIFTQQIQIVFFVLLCGVKSIFLSAIKLLSLIELNFLIVTHLVTCHRLFVIFPKCYKFTG